MGGAGGVRRGAAPAALSGRSGPDGRSGYPLCEAGSPAGESGCAQNAVLLAGAGALCAGGTEGDVEALRALLRKGCAAWLYAREEPGSRALGRADALAQRLVYQTSYRRKGSAC